jgi:hypothetical protein
MVMPQDDVGALEMGLELTKAGNTRLGEWGGQACDPSSH